MEQYKKEEIIYPEDTALIITRLMEKYELHESFEDVLEKAKRGEVSIGEKIARSIKEVAENERSIEELPLILKQRLEIEERKAEALAEDIKKEILSRIEKLPSEEELKISPTKKLISEKEKVDTETPIKKSPDIYREPIE